MNLQCLNDIITNNLAIQIDLTQLKSWDLNSGFTCISLSKWNNAISDNINLIDFGLTSFDNGRNNIMWSGITITPNDTKFTMYRVGYNVIQNPISGETSGVTITTEYNGYSISGITSGNTGNYFELNGGYLQGFFKLQDYNYELLPSRFNNGITIETLINLNPNSSGIFYMMGLRAEDKYNQIFSGETTTGGTINDIILISGVTTSENNYLDAYYDIDVNKKAFSTWETKTKKENKEISAIDNIKNNVISFFLTTDKRLGYKYVDDTGLIVENISEHQTTTTGWTMISISFIPNEVIKDLDLINCAPRRTGKLIFYINGRANWILNEFPEYYFWGFKNQKKKQIGVPYSISWGGGSFGLRYSWHYDYKKYYLYNGQNTQYINDKFWVQNNPFPDECEIPANNDYLPGLLLSADSTTFYVVDKCNPLINNNLTVMRVEFTGTTGITGMTGNSAMTYFIKFNQPISVLSNRDYEIDLSIFNNGFFNKNNEFNVTYNKAKIIVYGTVDIDIIEDVEYSYPLTNDDLLKLQGNGLYPFPDKNEFQYIRNNITYYGATGIPVIDEYAYIYGFNQINSVQGGLVTGENGWKPLKCVFKTKDNSGQQTIFIGLLLESSNTFELNSPLFINDFTYKGADILVQDPKKNNLLIQENFDSSFIGGIQKLRIYDIGLTSPEILHNTYIESKNNPNLNIHVNKGGRIIYS